MPSSTLSKLCEREKKKEKKFLKIGINGRNNARHKPYLSRAHGSRHLLPSPSQGQQPLQALMMNQPHIAPRKLPAPTLRRHREVLAPHSAAGRSNCCCHCFPAQRIPAPTLSRSKMTKKLRLLKGTCECGLGPSIALVGKSHQTRVREGREGVAGWVLVGFLVLVCDWGLRRCSRGDGWNSSYLHPLLHLNKSSLLQNKKTVEPWGFVLHYERLQTVYVYFLMPVHGYLLYLWSITKS